jgi:hypothetical protein
VGQTSWPAWRGALLCSPRLCSENMHRHACRWLLTHTHVIVSWVFNLSYSLGLVYCSTWLIVNVAPEAAGAGVAEVSAYLNGCAMPKVRCATDLHEPAMPRTHTHMQPQPLQPCPTLQASPLPSTDSEHKDVVGQIPVSRHSRRLGAACGSGRAYGPHGSCSG